MNNLVDACAIHQEQWITDTMEELADYSHTKKYNRYMANLINEMRKNKIHKRKYTRKTIKFIIIAAIIIAMAVAITSFAIPVTREYVVQHFSTHSTYEVKGIEKAKKVKDLVINYIPAGFEQTEKFESVACFSYDYQNKDLFLSCSKFKTDGDYSFNTEKHAIKTLTKNNIDYIIYDTDKTLGVVWNNGQYMYEVTGNLTEEELLAIAYSME